MKIPKIVLDTNVLLVSIPEESKYHWIYKKIENEEIELFITNEILTEYIEIISKKFNRETADSAAEVLTSALNVRQIIPYYHWKLIKADHDDDKFVDCAAISNSVIVTEDHHFDVLKQVPFPRVQVLNIEEFKLLFKK